MARTKRTSEPPDPQDLPGTQEAQEIPAGSDIPEARTAPEEPGREAGLVVAPETWDEVVLQPASGADRLFFVGMIMIFGGTFQAIVNEAYFLLPATGPVLSLSYPWWGWAHLVTAIAVVLAGFGVLTGRTGARAAGVTFAAIGAALNVAFVTIFPAWAVTVITLDAVIVYGLVAYGREMDRR